MYPFIFARALLVTAALAYSLQRLFDLNILSMLESERSVMVAINILIVGSALFHLTSRDYYLPFLGPTIIPVKERETVGKLVDVELTGLTPNSRVLYWASNESEGGHIDNPIDAYRGYSNSGLAKTNINGDVKIRVNCPSTYNVGKFGKNKRLEQHVHYRVESQRFPGLFSRVHTKYIKC